ncbi:MAG: hypothetical protein QOE44_140 [Solirubrobacteraceae bacterium]|nr:hypothetical protein [Solirubrobacteraceae bacterium]
MDAETSDLATRRPPARIGGVALRPRSDPALAGAAVGLALTLAVVLAAGVGAYLAFGPVVHGGFDPGGLVDHLGTRRDALAAPFARWDSVWYLTIARDGYSPGAAPAFFPLYPLLVNLVGALGPGLLAGGVLVSVGSLLAGLRLLWRLTELEVGAAHPEAPLLAVLAVALGPMAFFLTAVYTESLYLALSVGAFLAARQGRWARAGALGALAAATRSEGLLLIGALVLLFADQYPGTPLCLRRPRPAAGARAGVASGAAAPPPRPRRRDAAWILLVPAGLGAYVGWLWLIGLAPLSPFTAQADWFRHFTGPAEGLRQGAEAAWGGARQLLSGQDRTIYFAPAGGDPAIAAWHNLLPFAFLLGALAPLASALRRLPLAYGAYAAAGLALALSYPVAPQPLASLPRFLVVLFPLQMAVGVWLARHPRLRVPVLGAGAAGLAAFTGLFATWHWVA